MRYENVRIPEEFNSRVGRYFNLDALREYAIDKISCNGTHTDAEVQSDFDKFCHQLVKQFDEFEVKAAKYKLSLNEYTMVKPGEKNDSTLLTEAIAKLINKCLSDEASKKGE